MSLPAGQIVNVPQDFHRISLTSSTAPTVEMVQRINQSNRTPYQNGARRSRKIASRKKIPTTADNPKLKRPLNSWIAFRSYYSTIFESLQQKDISGFLTFLWQYDPFKAMWSILAKAYSLIRDVKGKELAPLGPFLAINGPFVGIIAPADYLVRLGWVISMDPEGQVNLRHEPAASLGALNHNFSTSNLSVQDIIQYSYQTGYITDDGASRISSLGEQSMMMANVVRSGVTKRPRQSAAKHVSIPIRDIFAIGSVKPREYFQSRPHESRFNRFVRNHEVGEQAPSTNPVPDHLLNSGSVHGRLRVGKEGPDLGDGDSGVHGRMGGAHDANEPDEVQESANGDNDVGVIVHGTAAAPDTQGQAASHGTSTVGVLGSSTVQASTVDPTPLALVQAWNGGFIQAGVMPMRATRLDCEGFDPYMGSSFDAFDLSDFIWEDAYTI